MILPDGSEIAGIEVSFGTAESVAGRGRERPAQAMLRQALIALWQRGAFTAGTGNERVLALALQRTRACRHPIRLMALRAPRPCESSEKR